MLHNEDIFRRLKIAAIFGGMFLVLWTANSRCVPRDGGRRAAARQRAGIMMQPPLTEQEMAEARAVRLRALAGK